MAYEYYVYVADVLRDLNAVQDTLDRLGSDGWELINIIVPDRGISAVVHYFRRSIT